MATVLQLTSFVGFSSIAIWNLRCFSGVREGVVVLKALHLTIRVLLVLAAAFWVLVLVEVLPAFLTTGISGVRGKLLHIWSTGKVNLDVAWTCQDSLQLIHEGYTDLLVFVLLTWALLELKRFLGRRMAALKFIPTEGREPYPLDNA